MSLQQRVCELSVPEPASLHINVGVDGTIEMSAEDAQYFIRDGWTKLAEWTTDEAA
jgi:hypothetical protein